MERLTRRVALLEQERVSARHNAFYESRRHNAQLWSQHREIASLHRTVGRLTSQVCSTGIICGEMNEAISRFFAFLSYEIYPGTTVALTKNSRWSVFVTVSNCVR